MGERRREGTLGGSPGHSPAHSPAHSPGQPSDGAMGELRREMASVLQHAEEELRRLRAESTAQYAQLRSENNELREANAKLAEGLSAVGSRGASPPRAEPPPQRPRAESIVTFDPSLQCDPIRSDPIRERSPGLCGSSSGGGSGRPPSPPPPLQPPPPHPPPAPPPIQQRPRPIQSPPPPPPPDEVDGLRESLQTALEERNETVSRLQAQLEALHAEAAVQRDDVLATLEERAASVATLEAQLGAMQSQLLTALQVRYCISWLLIASDC